MNFISSLTIRLLILLLFSFEQPAAARAADSNLGEVQITERELKGFAACVIANRLDGKFIAVGDNTGKLAVLWKDKDYIPIWETVHEHPVRSLTWARRGESLAVCFGSGYGASWPMGTFILEAEQTDKVPTRQLKSGFVRVRKTRPELVTDACWSFTGAYFAVGAREQEIGLSRRVQEPGQIPKNEPYANILPGGPVADMDWSLDERNLLAIGLRTGAVRVWDANLPEGLLVNVPSNKDGTTGATTVTRLAIKEHRAARKFRADEEIEQLCWLRDGQWIAIRTSKALHFWKPETGEEVVLAEKFNALCSNPAFHEVVVAKDEHVTVLGLSAEQTLSEIAKFQLPEKCHSLSWTSDGRSLLLGGTGKFFTAAIHPTAN